MSEFTSAMPEFERAVMPQNAAAYKQAVIQEVKDVAKSSMLAPVGAVVGFKLANDVFKVKEEVIPGVNIELSLAQESGAHFNGLAPGIHAPELVSGTPVPGYDGANIDITEFNYSGGLDGLQSEYASLISHVQDTLVDSAQDALMNHILKGAGLGALAATFAGYVGLRTVRHFKNREKRQIAHADSLDAEALNTHSVETVRIAHELRSEAERSQRRRTRLARYMAPAALSALVIALGVGGNDVNSTAGPLSEDQKAAVELKAAKKTPEPPRIPLSPLITENIEGMEGATCAGLACEAINLAAYGAIKYTEGVDEKWQRGADNMAVEFERFYEEVGYQYIGNPDYLSVVEVSDLHCNYSNYANYLTGQIVRSNPDVILNAGDTFTNADNMPFESGCYTRFLDDAQAAAKTLDKEIAVISVAGNHDPNEPVEVDESKYPNLNIHWLHKDKPYAEVGEWLKVVGVGDETLSIFPPELPSDPEESRKLVAANGSSLAEAACKLQTETEAPSQEDSTYIIAMAHRRQAVDETHLRGCADMVVHGHYHEDKPVESSVADNGREVIRDAVGSASGAHASISIYEGPQKDAVISQFWLNKTTLKPDLYASYAVHPNLDVEITTQYLPNDVGIARNDFDMAENVDTYSETYKQPAASKSTP